MNKKLPVIFRKCKEGIVTAIFPTEPATSEGNYVVCYEHIGQHGSCSRDWYRTTKPVSPQEYEKLLEELISIGYNDLKISRTWHWTYEQRFLINQRK